MFGSKNRGTVIAKGLKIVGTVTAEGLVEVNGRVDGELHCTSLVISRGAHVAGTIAAGRVVVDGNVEGPIQGGDVILKSKAHVVGDIHHQSLSIESGAFFYMPGDKRRNCKLCDFQSVCDGRVEEHLMRKRPESRRGTSASICTRPLVAT